MWLSDFLVLSKFVCVRVFCRILLLQFSGLPPGSKRRSKRLQPEPMPNEDFDRLVDLLPTEPYGQVLLDMVVSLGEARVAPEYLQPFVEGNVLLS